MLAAFVNHDTCESAVLTFVYYASSMKTSFKKIYFHSLTGFPNLDNFFIESLNDVTMNDVFYICWAWSLLA